jgi:hypothetical protein
MACSIGNSIRVEELISLVMRVMIAGTADSAVYDDMGDMNAVGGRGSRAMLCASPRSANLPIAKAADWEKPFTPAVAPVNRMVPEPRGSMICEASRLTKNPPNGVVRSACDRVPQSAP